MPTPCLQSPSCLTPEINMLKVNLKLSDIHRVKFNSWTQDIDIYCNLCNQTSWKVINSVIALSSWHTTINIQSYYKMTQYIISPQDRFLPVTYVIKIKCVWWFSPTTKRGLSAPNRSIHNYLRSPFPVIKVHDRGSFGNSYLSNNNSNIKQKTCVQIYKHVSPHKMV